eukprot:4843287-Prymnesium_polylepis.1
MPARMVGSPVMVYTTRKSDVPPKGFPTYEETPESFRKFRNGILPGYAGACLVCRFAKGPARDVRAICEERHIAYLACWSPSVATERALFPSFWCAGHLPNARDKIGASPIGGVPCWAEEGMPHGQPSRYTTKQEPPPDQVSFMSKDLEARHVVQRVEYAQRVQGIVPGYAGFVPGANHTYGVSPFGGVPVVPAEDSPAE